MGSGGGEGFGYSVPRQTCVACFVSGAVATLAAYLEFFLYGHWGMPSPDPFPPPPSWLPAVGFLTLGAGVTVASWGFWLVVRGRRATVVIGEDSIAVRGWDGLEQEWPWERVLELRTGKSNTGLPLCRAYIELRNGGRKLQITAASKAGRDCAI